MARQETQMQKLGTLVTQARKGGVEAYTEIVRRLQDLVVGYAYSILGDFHLAEDAAQETFVAAYLDLPSLSRVEAFTGWLRRIASRRCTRLTRGKHLSTVPVEQEADLVATNPGPEEVAERQEVRHFVQAAIQGLPQREREVTTLLYINGYSQKEVGDFLEITANAVRNRLHAARKKLRERMIGMVEETLHEQRPSKDEGFLDRVTDSLPTGTVTFLFTDIEGSTKLWGEYPKAMKKARAQHDALLREKIQEHSGYVFKTVGDAFCAAFDTARDALDAAIDVNRSLAAAKWEKTSPLKVRIALHIGAAQERDGDYFGPPLNRVARLLSIGHGGQILLSLPFEELIRDDLPEGVGLKDLGDQRLKDLIRPEQVFQVTAPELADDFPSLKSLDTFSHNLPIQLTSFVGREKEIAEAKRLLGSTRLLTATGPGGTGKTRLSLQVAADVVEEYPDGVWLVELDAVSDEAYVPQVVATVIGVRQEAGQSLVDTLAKHLATKEMLLVLDNCEHVV